jgi:hypothetical protein
MSRYVEQVIYFDGEVDRGEDVLGKVNFQLATNEKIRKIHKTITTFRFVL